jgi:hypothetical protein
LQLRLAKKPDPALLRELRMLIIKARIKALQR